MKKISVLLAMVLIVSLFAGCAGTPVVYNCTCPTVDAVPETSAPAAPEATEPAAAETAPVVEGAVKTGLAAVTGVRDSKSATAEENGEAKYDATVVAVTVDDNGVILECIIDSINTSVKFDATGVITSDLTAGIATKNELGDAYMMTSGSWKQQAGALAAFAVGKTVEELKSGAIDETGKAPEGSDLATSASIYLGGYVAAIEKAVANAQHLGAQAGDVLKLATMSSLGKSASADSENAGSAQLDSDVVALTMNGETITSVIIDSIQAKVTFDATGAITSDVSAPAPTKNDLGDAYMMTSGSWKQQAAALAAFATGKTVEELKSGAIDETGKAPEGSDLATSASIYLGGYIATIEKAAQ